MHSLNGYNNNPNVLQFKGAFRKLLCNIKIEAPETGNFEYSTVDFLTNNDRMFSNVFTVSSRRPKVTLDSIENEYQQQKDNILEDMLTIGNIDEGDPLLDAASNYTFAYISTKIENKIIETIGCSDCLAVFQENEKLAEMPTHISLRLSCRSTYDICKHTDKFIKLYDIRKSNGNYDFKVIYCLIFRSLNFNSLFVDSKFNCAVGHKYELIKSIVRHFVSIKSAYISRDITLDQYKKVCRQQLNKLVLHRGQ